MQGPLPSQCHWGCTPSSCVRCHLLPPHCSPHQPHLYLDPWGSPTTIKHGSALCGTSVNPSLSPANLNRIRFTFLGEPHSSHWEKEDLSAQVLEVRILVGYFYWGCSGFPHGHISMMVASPDHINSTCLASPGDDNLRDSSTSHLSHPEVWLFYGA